MHTARVTIAPGSPIPSAQPAGRHDTIRITWVTRSFLDYRVPVFAELDKLVGGRLCVIYSARWTPDRVQQKLGAVLYQRAIALTGERRLGNDGRAEFANSSVCIPYQPGLFKAIRRTNPDLLVGDGFFRWTPAALAYKLWYGKPLVLCYERTFHTERSAQWFRSLYRKAAVRRTDAICCSGQLSADYTVSLGMPRERITAGHIVADTVGLQQRVTAVTAAQRCALARELGIRGLCFLFVGRLIRLKGARELLAAWRRFEPGHEATLLIVGDGPERPALESMARENGLSHVRFVGAIDYDRIAPYFALADLLIMPTLEDNWSLVVPEAMACGLPILCSRYNGCWPELVHQDVNGWVFDPLDQADLVRALEKAAAHRARLPEMGQQSLRIVADFTPATAARAVLDACRIALSPR